jgi:hypothetical protein
LRPTCCLSFGKLRRPVDGQDAEVNPVLDKTLCVLGHAELFEPVCNVLHRNRQQSSRRSRPRQEAYNDMPELARKSLGRVSPIVGGVYAWRGKAVRRGFQSIVIVRVARPAVAYPACCMTGSQALMAEIRRTHSVGHRVLRESSHWLLAKCRCGLTSNIKEMARQIKRGQAANEMLFGPLLDCLGRV